LPVYSDILKIIKRLVGTFTIFFKGLGPNNILVICRSQPKLHGMRSVPDMNFQESPSNGVEGKIEKVYLDLAVKGKSP
jgi:hypothetical protein